MPKKNAHLLMLPKRLAPNIGKLDDLNNYSESYYPTRQSISFIDQVAKGALQGGSAHSLQGAYGAGKSSLAIFALNQLSCATKTFSPKTNKSANNGQLLAAKKIRQKGGLLSIPIVGSVAPLASRITIGMKQLATEYKGVKPRILKKLSRIDPFTVSTERTLDLLELLANEAFTHEKAGVLLIIDEFGRHLEHMLANRDFSDLHLLQGIAENTGYKQAALSLIIIQHQSLEYYSRKFLLEQRTEWEKVRGRFRETTLNNSEIDTAHIIDKLCKSIQVSEKIQKTCRLNSKSKEIGLSVLRDKEFIVTANDCAPLHYLSIVLLSRLARLLGQNDRTVVGWLTSELDTGFAAVAKRAVDGCVRPADLFEHFFGDVLLTPSNPVLARRYASIHSAYARLEENNHPKALTLLQTIAILNFCKGGGLSANKPTITACLPKNFPLQKSIKILMEKSIIVHRIHRREYCVWEGSDYDIAGQIYENAQNLDISVATELNRNYRKKILAHAHLINTGNHRTADMLWQDSQTEIPESSKFPRILIWLDKTASTFKPSKQNDVWGVMKSSGIKSMLLETSVIQHLIENDYSLQQDTVALEEIKQQQEFLNEQIDAYVNHNLNSKIEWHFQQKKYDNLQQALTKAIDTVYFETVILHNELINRTRVSGSITGAIRRLIEAIFEKANIENFGISKFPAERIIYESLFKNTLIHKQNKDGSWQLTLSKSEIREDMVPLIKALSKQFKAGKTGKPQELQHVLEILAAAPYGLKRTPALLLSVVFLLVHRDQAELYEEHLYLPNWGAQTLVRMVRAPETFAIAITTNSKINNSILSEYRQVLASKPSKNKNTPINLARDLLLRYEQLSTHAKQTDAVSEKAQKFRRAISIARSPADMLFKTIPNAFGLAKFPDGAASRKKYFKQIDHTIAELENTDRNLIKCFEKILLQIYECNKTKKARELLIKHSKQVLNDSRMYHAHEQFLNAVTGNDNDNNKVWLKSVMNYGLELKTPIEAWNDAQIAQAEFMFRRNLIGLQQAATILQTRKKNAGKEAFVIWAPNSDLSLDHDIAHLKKYFKDTPPEQIKPKLLHLLKYFNT